MHKNNFTEISLDNIEEGVARGRMLRSQAYSGGLRRVVRILTREEARAEQGPRPSRDPRSAQA